MATSETFQFQVADWSRRDGGWARAGVVVIERNRDGGWAMTDVSGDWSVYACPDAAREAADAYLVRQGRLDKSRAFVRLGEWECSGEGRWHRTRSGSGDEPSVLCGLGDDGREESDRFSVAKGWLDPSRAFKAGPVGPSVNGGPLLLTGATGAASPWPESTATRMQPEKYDSEPKWAYPGPGVRTTVMPLGGSRYVIPEGHSLDDIARKINADTRAPITATVANGAIVVEPVRFGPAKPAWGEWGRIGVAYVRRPSDRGAVPAAAYADRWELGGNRQSLATDIDAAREKADAYLVARGELEAGRAFKRVVGWTREPIAPDEDRRFTPSVANTDGQNWCASNSARGWRVFYMHGHSMKYIVVEGPETGDAGKAAADAELVRRGLLAEERAFKVAAGFDPVRIYGNGAVVHGIPPNAIAEVTYDGGKSWCPVAVGDAIGQGGKMRLTSTQNEPFHGHTVTTPRPITEHTTVTLANWERCLPHLLSNAPREFRDGFNRKQGPAWEAYLVALAGVKERIQLNQLHAAVSTVSAQAAMKAYESLGPEWVKANV